MARCGCGGKCSCVVTSGQGIRVTGDGSPDNPYEIVNDGGGSDHFGTGTDGLITTGFFGNGTVDDPYRVAANLPLADSQQGYRKALFVLPDGLGSIPLALAGLWQMEAANAQARTYEIPSSAPISIQPRFDAEVLNQGEELGGYWTKNSDGSITINVTGVYYVGFRASIKVGESAYPAGRRTQLLSATLFQSGVELDRDQLFAPVPEEGGQGDSFVGTSGSSTVKAHAITGLAQGQVITPVMQVSHVPAGGSGYLPENSEMMQLEIAYLGFPL